MANDAIQKYLSDSTEYVTFPEDGIVQAKFIGSEEEKDPFSKEEDGKRIVYLLEIDGKLKRLGSKSIRLARAFLNADPQEGDFIKIIRTGTLFNTQYVVEKGDIPF